MRKTIKTFALASLICLSFIAKAQNTPKVSLYGFVRTDLIFDTRQTVYVREGNLNMFPTNELLDEYGNDINNSPMLNYSSIGSRMGIKATGPDILGAKVTGVLESEFFGISNATVNTLRLRHAYMKMNWTNQELLIGQTWHPLFTEECFPTVINFNTGIPFQPFNRSPQIRYTYTNNNFKLQLATLTERDFTTPGPAGASFTYLSNNAIPEFTAGAHYKKPSADSTKTFATGVVGEYKIFRPRMTTNTNVITTKKLSSAAAVLYAGYLTPKFDIKAKATYGQNMFNHLMIGGYAIRHFDAMSIDEDLDYTNLEVAAAWLNFTYKFNSKLHTGLFAGYAQNMGSKNNIYDWNNLNSYYGRAFDIAYLYRFSARIEYNVGKVQFGFEPEYSVAAYGNQRNSLGVLQNNTENYPTSKIKEKDNIRLLGAVTYTI